MKEGPRSQLYFCYFPAFFFLISRGILFHEMIRWDSLSDGLILSSEGGCMFLTKVNRRSQKRVTKSKEFHLLVFMVQSNVRTTDHH